MTSPTPNARHAIVDAMGAVASESLIIDNNNNYDKSSINNIVTVMPDMPLSLGLGAVASESLIIDCNNNHNKPLINNIITVCLTCDCHWDGSSGVGIINPATCTSVEAEALAGLPPTATSGSAACR